MDSSATSTQASSATTSRYTPYLTTFTSVNAFNYLATFTQTIPPEVLTTYTTSNNFGIPLVVTTELPQSQLTTYATSNSLGLGYFVTAPISSDTASTGGSSTSTIASDSVTSSPSQSSPASSSQTSASTASSAPSSNISRTSSGLSGGDIAAAVVVPIVVVALLLVALFFFLRRRKQRRQQGPLPDAGYHHDSDFSGSAGNKSVPPMSEADGPITALPRMGATGASTAHSKTGPSYTDQSVSSLPISEAPTGGYHNYSHEYSASGGAARGRPSGAANEPIAELPAGDVPDADAASIDSDFSFHHAEVADASQARKERASVVQLHSGTPPKSGSPKETGSPM